MMIWRVICIVASKFKKQTAECKEDSAATEGCFTFVSPSRVSRRLKQIQVIQDKSMSRHKSAETSQSHSQVCGQVQVKKQVFIGKVPVCCNSFRSLNGDYSEQIYPSAPGLFFLAVGDLITVLDIVLEISQSCS